MILLNSLQTRDLCLLFIYCRDFNIVVRMSDVLFGGGIAVGNRLVSLRLWNSEGDEVAESDRTFYGWLPPSVNNEKFDELRNHLVFCASDVMLDCVMDLVNQVNQGNKDESSLNSTKLGELIKEVNCKILTATVKTTQNDENKSQFEIDVLFDVNNIVNEVSSISSQDSNDLDSFESWEFLTERLNNYFHQ